MFRMPTLAAAAVCLVFGASIAEAGWARSGSATGPRGHTWTGSSSGTCAGGSCSASRTVTGPHGGSASRSWSGSCAGGTCSGTRTTTGPYGGTVTRSGTITRH